MSITDCDSTYGPGAGHLDQQGVGDNPYPYGECTWYCWQYYHDLQGVNIHGQLGNAADWVNSAHREQWAVDQLPAVGKTVSWSAAKYPPFGHVAVVTGINADGTFTVTEMNFTYYARDKPELAGKIDCRVVKDKDGVQGFITPTGVRVGESNAGAGNDALTIPLTSIGDAIRTAGLHIQAAAMTAELKAVCMGEVALGTVIGGSGLTLAALTAYGGGRPGAGYSRAAAGVRRGVRRVRSSQTPLVGEPGPRLRKGYTETEQRWLSPAETRALRERAIATARAGPAPASTAPAAAASPETQLRAEIRSAQAARQAAGRGGRGWTEATVRLRTAQNRLATLRR